MEFTAFLSWSRRFIADHRRDEWRRVWGYLKEHRARHRAATCDQCERSVVETRTRAYWRNREGSLLAPYLTCWNCGDCLDCCECVTCDCGRRSSATCSNCVRCEDCCNCPACTSCGDRNSPDNTCSNCDRCTSCCVCSDSPVHYFNSALTFWKPKVSERTRNKSARFLAAEIEVAHIVKHGDRVEKVIQDWKGSVVPDGSLPNGGFEINTAPAGGDKFVEQITAICGALEKAGASVDRCCGCHVHIDARDMDFYAVRRLITIYASMEPALFAMVPETRRRNAFCSPCGEEFVSVVKTGRISAAEVRNRIHQAIYRTTDEGRLAEAKRSKCGAERYKALNLHSWCFRGSVECRLLDGTVDADDIINWGALWARILDFAQARTDEDAEAFATEGGLPIDRLLTIASDDLLVEFVKARTKKHRTPTLSRDLQIWLTGGCPICRSTERGGCVYAHDLCWRSTTATERQRLMETLE